MVPLPSPSFNLCMKSLTLTFSAWLYFHTSELYFLPPFKWIFLFTGFPGIHLSHEKQVQLDYIAHTCINLHVYNDDEQQVLFNRDFARENFAGTEIGTRNLPFSVFFIAAL